MCHRHRISPTQSARDAATQYNQVTAGLRMASEKNVRVSPPVLPRTTQLSPLTIAIFLRVLHNR